MSFLVKRFTPAPEGPKPKPKKIKAEERSSVLESRFVDVFRSLKAQTAPVEEKVVDPGSDWLKKLRAPAPSTTAQNPAVAPAMAKTPFWRPSNENADKSEVRERRAFVRADAKQQRTAAKRKIKGRRLN